MNIVLIGYRASGKTTVGKIIATRLGMEFVDTDMLVEQKLGKSIGEIVSSHGWPAFRAAEQKVIKELARRDNTVLATGGGVVEDECNRRSLLNCGWIVWLDCPERVIRKRLRGDERAGNVRPALLDGDPESEVREVLKRRIPLYRELSHVVVNTGSLSPPDVAEQIIKQVHWCPE